MSQLHLHYLILNFSGVTQYFAGKMESFQTKHGKHYLHSKGVYVILKTKWDLCVCMYKTVVT